MVVEQASLMWWVPLVSALAGAVVALLGGAASGWLERARAARTAAIMVEIELRQNEAYLREARKRGGGVGYRPRDGAWVAGGPALAARLPPELMTELSVVYGEMRRIAQLLPEGMGGFSEQSQEGTMIARATAESRQLRRDLLAPWARGERDPLPLRLARGVRGRAGVREKAPTSEH